MDFAVIISERDKASLNIKDSLLENKLPKNLKIHTIKEESIKAENLDKKIKADFFIFATKHQSKEERKTLSLHIPGNWGKAEMGGRENKLVPVFPSFFKTIFIELNNQAKNSGYEVSTEQVHHGPYLETPCLFIEIGSTLNQWTDKAAGKIIAKTIIKAVENHQKKYKTLLLLGGQHYNQRANKILLETNYTISYICAKHSLKDLDENMLKQAFEKCKEPTEFILLDWKGLGSEKSRIKELLDLLKLPYKRSV